jgi:flagellar FliJ protein
VKRFSFRLQSLLDYRRTVEEARLGEFARLQHEEQSELARLVGIRTAQRDAWETLAGLRATGTDSWELARADEHCKTLGDDLGLQELNLAAARRKVEAKLVEVVEAARERKVLEQLRDKQKSEYELSAAMIEQKELDDMASVRFARGAA